jgi:hypothetical protein
MDLAPGVAAGFLQQLQKVQSGVMKRKMAAGGGLLALAAAAYVGTSPFLPFISPNHSTLHNLNFPQISDSEPSLFLFFFYSGQTQILFCSIF